MLSDFLGYATKLALIALVFTSGCASLMYQPDHNLYFEPQANGYTPEEVRYKTSDGVELYAWLFRAENAKGTIIQFHGNSQNLSSHYASLVWLTHYGYNLFTFDYRGYGRSKGSPNPLGLYLDALASLEQASKLNTGKLIIYAQSMGVPVALRSVSESKLKIDLLVLDSGFTSYKQIYSSTMQKIWFLWPFSLIPYLTISDEYAGTDYVSTITIPTLVIHDKHDPVVSFDLGFDMFDKLNYSKSMWITDLGEHVAVFSQKLNQEAFVKYLSELK